MCRWLSYRGTPVWLEDFIARPDNSLIEQSLRARLGHTTTNGDGFGLGWYAGRPNPGQYRETMPAWNDPNLASLIHQLRAGLFFAHVRASTGTASTRQNCHPFVHGRWMFMHNGQIGGYRQVRRRLEALIPDSHYPYRLGTTDSELFFLLLFREDVESDPAGALVRTVALVEAEMQAAGLAEAFRMTAALSDGERLICVRHAGDPDPPSLFYDEDDKGLTVVSEPLDDKQDWREVPGEHLLIAEAGRPARLEAFR